MSSVDDKKKRFKYSKDALKEAMAAISAGMPILRASTKYKIPRSTLHNKRRSQNIDKKPGPETVLTANEEEILVQWIFDCSNVGMPVAKQQLLNSVSLLLKSLNRDNPFTNGRPGNHWYRNFLTRNEKIVERITDNIAIARAAATESGVRNWFANVQGYLQEKRLLVVDPSRVFCSHTVLLTNPVRNSENLGVQMTGNAAGRLTCPMIVFTEEKTPAKVMDMMPPGWFIGKSEAGDVTAENFLEYIKGCFHPWLVANNIEFPVILFLNGRVSHVTLLLTDFCKKHRIELIALHPNSLNLIHPMEMLFEPLRRAWETALNRHCEVSRGAVIPKQNIAPLLKSIIDTIKVTELLKNGFVTSGLYPLSVDVVDFTKIPEKPAEKVPKERVEFRTYVATHEPVEQKRKLSDKVFLRMLEQRMDPETLQAFKVADKSAAWPGRVEDTALFFFWKNAADRAANETDDSDSRPNFAGNNVDYSDNEFDNVNNFLEIESLPEESTEPVDQIKIFLKMDNP